MACAHGERHDEAVAALERAEKETAGSDLRYAQAHIDTGQPERARDLAEQSLTIARGRGARGDVAWALYLIGNTAPVSAGDTRAADALAEALAIARELEMRPLEARTRLALGRLHLETGRLPSARGELTRAISDFRDMRMTPWRAEADALLARLT